MANSDSNNILLFGWNPPCPNNATASSTTITTTNAGIDYFYSSSSGNGGRGGGDDVHTSFNVDCQRLLYLVKSFDKYKQQQQQQQQTVMVLFDEITILLKKMIAYYTRRGRVLFVSSSSSSSSSTSGGGNNNAPTTTTTTESGKQKSKNNNNSNAKNSDILDHDINNENNTSTSSSDCDNLLCLAMIRIFNSVTKNNNNNNNNNHEEEKELKEEDALFTEEELCFYLIELCSELCIAICHKLQIQGGGGGIVKMMDPNNNWNNEILTKFGKPILSTVVQTMKRMLLLLVANNNSSSSNNNNNVIIGPFLGCLKVSTLLIDTFRTKYGRSYTILSDLYDISWSCCCCCYSSSSSSSSMTIHHDSIQRVAATLIATLPLCGYNYSNNTYCIPGSSGTLKGTSSSSSQHTFSTTTTTTTTPSDIWNSTMKDVLWSLSTIFHTMAPTISKGTTMTANITNNNNSNKDPTISSSSNYMRSIVQTWINTLENNVESTNNNTSNNSNTTEQQQRQTVICNALHRYFTGLTYCYRSLVTAQTTTTTLSTKSSLIGTRMDITSVLDIVEAFLSFPLSAESLYYRTKKRLRMEVVGIGLLSPHSIAIYMASKMKQLGHVILDCTINALGGSILLPYYRRILRICYAALLTSSSYPVRSLVDPTNLRNVVGNNNNNTNKPMKRKWLHTSIFLRTKAIQTFQYVSLSFGSDGGSSSSSNKKWKKSNTSTTTTNSSTSRYNQNDGLMMIDSNCSDGERTILLIAGCLVEQLNWNGGGVAAIDDDDWGSLSERVDLVQKATEALTACLVSWGGFTSPPARSLIDSIATTGLSKTCLINSGSSIAIDSSNIKVAMLRLASACLTTPYPDGASSSICDLLTNVAKKCAMDCNSDVALAARTALRVCDEATVPRGVAIEYTTRILASSAVESLTSPASLLNQTIQSARADIMESEKSKKAQEAATPKSKRNKSPLKERTCKGMPDETQSRKKPKTINHEEPVVSKPSADEKTNVEVLPTDNGRSQIDGESYPIEALSTEENNVDGAGPNHSMDLTEHHNGTQKLSEVAKNSEAESEGDDDFPDIVDGGGPDSDDD